MSWDANFCYWCKCGWDTTLSGYNFHGKPGHCPDCGVEIPMPQYTNPGNNRFFVEPEQLGWDSHTRMYRCVNKCGWQVTEEDCEDYQITGCPRCQATVPARSVRVKKKHNLCRVCFDPLDKKDGSESHLDVYSCVANLGRKVCELEARLDESGQ